MLREHEVTRAVGVEVRGVSKRLKGKTVLDQVTASFPAMSMHHRSLKS